MSTAGRRAGLCAWIFAATFALGHIWLVRPDLGPPIPRALSLRLVELYGSSNGEELRDLETLVALSSAFTLVLVVTVSGLLIWRQLRKKTRL